MSYMPSKKEPSRRRKEISKSQAGGSAKSSDSEIHESSGNVFLDLGFSPEESRNLQLRADLIIAATRLIERRKLTQAQAAKLMHVSQPRISDLLRGKIELFSVDSLIAMLDLAGAKIEIRVRAA